MQSPRITLAWKAHRIICGLAHIPATECAYGDCPMPGYPLHQLAWPVLHGTERRLFCSPAHREAWLLEETCC